MSSDLSNADASVAMGPDHSAIVFPNDPPSRPEPAAPAQPTHSHYDHLEEAVRTSSVLTEEVRRSRTIRRRFAELAGQQVDDLNGPNTTRPPSLRVYTPNLFGPRSPTEPPHATSSRRPLLTSLLGRYSSSSTDSATSLGRRVAARVSAGNTTPSEVLRADVSEFVSAADASLTVLARHRQQLLASSRDFRQIGDRNGDDPETGSSARIPGDGLTTLSAGPPNTSSAMVRRYIAYRSPVWRQNQRDRRARHDPDSRGTAISFAPEDNTAPPYVSWTSTIPRPLGATSAANLPSLSEPEEPDPSSRRGLRIRRRLNPAPDNEIQYSYVESSDDDDGQSFWSRPRRRPSWAGLSPARIWPEGAGGDGEGDPLAAPDEASGPLYWFPSDPYGIPQRYNFSTQSSLSASNLPRRRRRGWGKLVILS